MSTYAHILTLVMIHAPFWGLFSQGRLGYIMQIASDYKSIIMNYPG